VISAPVTSRSDYPTTCRPDSSRCVVPGSRLRRGEKRVAGRAISGNRAVRVRYQSVEATAACGRFYAYTDGRFPPALRNHSITPTRALSDVRDASQPATTRRAPRGARRSDGGFVVARTARRGRPRRQGTQGRFEPARSRHDHATGQRRSRNWVSSSPIQFLRSTPVRDPGRRLTTNSPPTGAAPCLSLSRPAHATDAVADPGASKTNLLPTYERMTFCGMSRSASAMNTSPVQCMGIR